MEVTGMAHRFNPEESAKLDNPERRRVLPPEKTLRELGLREGDSFVDIGCGTGYFTIPAIDIVGPGGRVFGIDVSERMLDKLRERTERDQLDRLTLIKSDGHSLGLQVGIVSFAFMANVLHEIEDRKEFLQEIYRSLVPGGRFALIDWVKKVGTDGPRFETRLDLSYVKQLLEDSGFILKDTGSLGDDFYTVLSSRGDG
jgi:ubiquinone/menaquinone biosynthesis C-methylase UbiE